MMQSKKKTISMKARLWLLSGSLVVTSIIIGTAGLVSAQRLGGVIDNVVKNDIAAVKNMTLIDMCHDNLRAIISEATLNRFQNKTTELNDAAADYTTTAERMQNFTSSIEKLHLTDRTRASLEAAKPVITSYIAHGQVVVKDLLSENNDNIETSRDAFYKEFSSLEMLLEKLADDIEADAQTIETDAKNVEDFSIAISIAGIGFGIFFGLIFSYISIRSLDHKISRVVQSLSEETTKLSDAVKDINQGSNSLADSAFTQSASTEETAASLAELRAMLEQTLRASEQGKSNTDDGIQHATDGNRIISDLENAMNDLSLSNEDLAKVVSIIADIQDRTSVINDIVFETRILAFNAAIEAERAGEYGRGFAVVASEVGKLAFQSGRSADEIRSLLDSSVKTVNGIVENNTKRVLQGKDTSIACKNVFSTLSDVLKKLGNQSDSIFEATKQQSTGVSQITEAMGQIEQATQETTGSADNLKETAKELSQVYSSVLSNVSSLNSILFGTADHIAVKEEGSKETPTANEAKPDKVIEVDDEWQKVA